MTNPMSPEREQLAEAVGFMNSMLDELRREVFTLKVGKFAMVRKSRDVEAAMLNGAIIARTVCADRIADFLRGGLHG